MHAASNYTMNERIRKKIRRNKIRHFFSECCFIIITPLIILFLPFIIIYALIYALISPWPLDYPTDKACKKAFRQGYVI